MTSLKRTASGDEVSSSKKQRNTGTRPLDGWLGTPLPKKPSPFGISKPLHDVDSVFIGYATPAESTQDIKKLREYVIQVANEDFRPDEPASHVAHGARMLSLKPGKSGLDETHFTVALHSENDGEANAGRTIIETLTEAKACDVVVVVSRWFGGSMLGPRRFADIRSVTLEALHNLRDQEELLELRKELEEKDKLIYKLLQQIASTAGGAFPDNTVTNYDDLDVTKGRRLRIARDARIKNLQQKIDKLEDEENEELPEISSSKNGSPDKPQSHKEV